LRQDQRGGLLEGSEIARACTARACLSIMFWLAEFSWSSRRSEEEAENKDSSVPAAASTSEEEQWLP